MPGKYSTTKKKARGVFSVQECRLLRSHCLWCLSQAPCYSTKRPHLYREQRHGNSEPETILSKSFKRWSPRVLQSPTAPAPPLLAAQTIKPFQFGRYVHASTQLHTRDVIAQRHHLSTLKSFVDEYDGAVPGMGCKVPRERNKLPVRA